jgi:BlaI family penicillinase repressor
MDELALGDRELDVMAVLWEIGSGTVTEVREKLPADLAYPTVLTILRKLETKGFLSREEEGKAHRYYPRVAQRTAQRSALGRMIEKLFAGSPELLVSHLVDDHGLSTDEVARVRRRLSQGARQRGRGTGGRDR